MGHPQMDHNKLFGGRQKAQEVEQRPCEGAKSSEGMLFQTGFRSRRRLMPHNRRRDMHHLKQTSKKTPTTPRRQIHGQDEAGIGTTSFLQPYGSHPLHCQLRSRRGARPRAVGFRGPGARRHGGRTLPDDMEGNAASDKRQRRLPDDMEGNSASVGWQRRLPDDM